MKWFYTSVAVTEITARHCAQIFIKHMKKWRREGGREEGGREKNSTGVSNHPTIARNKNKRKDKLRISNGKIELQKY